ncbi:hypothetical protein AB0C76_39225 [Kitasatospora sp. NPDC048722]|uniref:hypothetical protein n=1 Tax=Kitasatospora sp. NPDC048722 TaxID=3155639 RepID=UPI0033D3DEF2
MLFAIGSCGWKTWQEHSQEGACKPHREEALRLDQETAKVHIPLVLPMDPAVERLSIWQPEIDLSLPDQGASEAAVAEAYRVKRARAGKAAQVVMDHKDCFDKHVISRAADVEKSPARVSRVDMPQAATCADGWPSGAIGKRGACSHHGGVAHGAPWATLNF